MFSCLFDQKFVDTFDGKSRCLRAPLMLTTHSLTHSVVLVFSSLFVQCKPKTTSYSCQLKSFKDRSIMSNALFRLTILTVMVTRVEAPEQVSAEKLCFRDLISFCADQRCFKIRAKNQFW